MIKKVRKRDGSIVEFQKEKIYNAIGKSFEVGGKPIVVEQLNAIVDKVIEAVKIKEKGNRIPSVEDVQDVVERVLIEENLFDVAKNYILYREKRRELRETKTILTGVSDDFKLSLNGLKVLERRYLMKNGNGQVIETPREMFERVAKAIAKIDKKYDKNADTSAVEKEFYEAMTSFQFVPNSPTLMNAGLPLAQLSACFVLPVGDSMEEIFDAVKYTAIIHKTGGGTGFSFSRLRPQQDVVQSTFGVASGPLSFMRVFDTATDVVKQGGKRRGANMGILDVTHPDILNFIGCKEKDGVLANFNLSVGITEKFMKAVERKDDIELVNPRSGEVARLVNAKTIFDLLVYNAWKTGDPGIIFLDRLNKDNPTPKLGKIESTNPCGEQPLLPYEACNLGSINLSKFVKDGKVDWDALATMIKTAVHFLDNVIDASKFPLKEIEEMVRGNRKIGLGVMGWADMLIKLGIPYNSDDALKLASRLMKFVTDIAREKSQQMANERGEFPNFKDSIYKVKQRNATLTTIAPTGTISIIAGCSSGIEPLFGVVYMRNVMEGTELLEVNDEFKKMLIENNSYSDELLREIARAGSIRNIKNVSDDIKKLFVVAHDIAPEWHIKMQSAFQKYTDNAVSKTVNLPFNATPSDVEKIYMLGYKLGVKGITVYRDGCKSEQPMQIAKDVSMSNGLIKVDSEYSGDTKCEECRV